MRFASVFISALALVDMFVPLDAIQMHIFNELDSQVRYKSALRITESIDTMTILYICINNARRFGVSYDFNCWLLLL